MTDEAAPIAPKKRRAARAKAKPVERGRKTLFAACGAVFIAALDLFVTLRYGLKFF